MPRYRPPGTGPHRPDLMVASELGAARVRADGDRRERCPRHGSRTTAPRRDRAGRLQQHWSHPQSPAPPASDLPLWRGRDPPGRPTPQGRTGGKTWPTAVASVAVATTNVGPLLVAIELGCGYDGPETTPADAIVDNANAGILIHQGGVGAGPGRAGWRKMFTHQSVKTGAGVRSVRPTASGCGNARARPGCRRCAGPGRVEGRAGHPAARHRAAHAGAAPDRLRPADPAGGADPHPDDPAAVHDAQDGHPRTLTLPPTIRPGYAGGRSFATLRLGVTLPPLNVGYVGTRARRGIPPVVFPTGIRVMAQTILTDTWVHRELPVDGLRLSYRLSGANSITGTIGPEHRELAELLTALPPWGTWLHVEEGGMVAASGILMPGPRPGGRHHGADRRRAERVCGADPVRRRVRRHPGGPDRHRAAPVGARAVVPPRRPRARGVRRVRGVGRVPGRAGGTGREPGRARRTRSGRRRTSRPEYAPGSASAPTGCGRGARPG